MTSTYNSTTDQLSAGSDTRSDTVLKSKPPGTLWRNPRTGGWSWAVRPPGEPKRRNIALVARGQKTATKAKSIAQRCQRRLWREWTADGAKLPPTHSVAQWIDRFEQWNRMSASDRWARYNADVVRKYTRQQQVRQAWQIDLRSLQAYLMGLRERGLSPATQHRHRSSLSKFCRFLARHEQLDGNPASLCEVERTYQRPPRYLTTDQVSTLMDVADGSPVQPAILLALATGLRLGELRSLRWGDVRDGGIVVGSRAATKTYAWRVVPLGADVRRAIGPPAGDDEPVFAEHQPKWWLAQLRRITRDLPVFGELGGRVGDRWHLLRSTFAVEQARRGRTLWELMQLLGHRTPQTTMRYVNIARAAGAK